jgi:beta-fructofuranosidase
MGPAPELEALRGEHFAAKDVSAAADTPLAARLDTAGLEARASFDLFHTDAASFGLGLSQVGADGNPVSGRLMTEILVDTRHEKLLVGPTSFDLQRLPGEPDVTLHLFIDKGILEVFANGRECVSVPAPFAPGAAFRVSLLARGGKAQARSVDVWEMKPATGGESRAPIRDAKGPAD